LSKSVFKHALCLSVCAVPLIISTPASAQFTQNAAGSDRTLALKADSPFRDPDVIYLEADELVNDEVAGVITASGQVEGRYQDRTLRAEKVVYTLATGVAYYTACEPCMEDGKTKKPSWRIKARKVRQDKDSRTIRYNDAVFEFLGVPLFWTPYLAHPDPSAGRASGLLTPFGGLSASKGLNFRLPYYWAIDDYTEATFTPHVFQRVNPLMEYQFARKFNTGVFDVEGSFTYSNFFDRRGDVFEAEDFVDPTQLPGGKKLRSHVYAKGLFAPNETWTYGFGAQLSTDDNYLNRYDQNEAPERFGLYEAESRRNISQAFIVGQDDSLALTRGIGTDYMRGTAGADYSKTFIAPGGIEVKPFGNARYDYFDIKPADRTERDDDANEFQDVSFGRTVGQVGVDVRYPFIKSSGGVDWIIEPRAQITQSFGDGRLENFSSSDSNGENTISTFQDGVNVDLDQALFWQNNKATGYDFWQEGTRADVGASFIADADKTRAHLFLGQSYIKSREGSHRYGL